MFGNNGIAAFFLAALLLGLTPPAIAQQAVMLGAHRFGSMAEFRKVIDARCTICHTGERVEKAIKERRNLEEIERAMQAQGAILSAHDKKVLGAFWGTPLKGSGSSPPFPAPPAGPTVSSPPSK